jgi:hypothetical protein
MAEEGRVHESQPVAVPALAPAPAPAGQALGALAPAGAGVTAAHVLALSRAAGNAAVARAIASGRLITRQPAPAAAPAAEPAAGVPAPPVPGAVELSQAPFAELLRAVEGFKPREEWLQAHFDTPGVDAKRLNMADQIVSRKETGIDEAGVVDIAQDLYIVGAPVEERDAVFTYLGFAGLALPSSIEAFAAASSRAAAAIATMKSFEERAEAVRGVINARLTAARVPAIGPISKEGGGNAHFKKQTWTVTVDPDFAMRGGPAAPAELLTTVYHEARHAEQEFLVARDMARDKSAAEIAAAHEVPIEIANAAKASPLPADDPQAELAQRLRGPVPDEGPDPELAAIRPRLIDKKARGEEFTPEEKAILDRAYARYKSRPNEADAFLVEALAKQQQALPSRN